ncbi:MAG: HIT family protein [Clostridia bacterium]
MSCVFCDMMSGRAPASVVYQDERVYAAMDIVQPSGYKVLVMPKRHVRDIFELEDDEAAALFAVVPDIARAIREVSGCTGLNVLQSNGRDAGQTVDHLHIHLFPRFPQDGVVFHWDGEMTSREDLDRMAEEIAARISDR